MSDAPAIAPAPAEAPDVQSVALPKSRKLTGRQKAAVLLVALGAERAAGVFRHLRDEEIELLSLEMAQTETVPPEAAMSVFEEAAENAKAFEYFAEGGVDFAREVLENSLGAEKASEVLGRLSAIIEMRPFEFLRTTPPDQISAFLTGESHQTMALVVANLHTALAAQVLAGLSPEDQAAVAMKVATMNEISPEVIKDVESVLRNKLSIVVSQDYAASGGVKPLADILNNADRGTERNIIDRVAEVDPELAEEIRMLLFVFEDIVKLDDRAVQQVMKDVDQKDLGLALRGCSEEVKEKVLSNMSQRGREMLVEDMEMQPPQRRSVVEQAQSRVVAVVRRLEDAGAITIGRGDDEDDDDELV